MPNRLADELSPYLRQHADNPVDWWPWCQEAFAEARRRDVPVFLSIGYATCHWCHVMAHESFEDQEVAAALNRDFVAVKVDREERPDLDSVYMSVCQALTGQGGWPLSLFLTPEQKPFFAGTYFPKSPGYGRPGFGELLQAVAKSWREDREKLLTAGSQITQMLASPPEAEAAELGPAVMEKAYWQLARSHDPKWGGFGDAPKFPTPHQLGLLLRWHLREPGSKALEMAERTLTAMRLGGLFDQVGFGFHRYSVDRQWLVPHFEKMLYDQAQLAYYYLEAWQLTKKPLYADTARQVFTYVLRDMTSPAGGFYSAEDADSEGHEGRYYVWTPDGVKEVLGEELGRLYCRHFGIVQEGNFEQGLSIPWQQRPLTHTAEAVGLADEELMARLDQAREKLLDARGRRERPLLDDKVLAAWNGLMIAAMAKGALALGEPEYLGAARRAADFVATELTDDQGRLLRRWRQGQAAHPGFLEDYAFMIWGLIELYQAGFDPDHLGRALELAETMNQLFWDDLRRGYWFTPRHGEELIIRAKDLYDGATPSGNSVAAWCLLRLSRLTGDSAHAERARQLMEAVSGRIAQNPTAHCHMLMALDLFLGPGQELVVAGDPLSAEARELLSQAAERFLPRAALMANPGGETGARLAELAPFAAGMGPVDGRTAAYLCRDFACQRPLTDPGELAAALD